MSIRRIPDSKGWTSNPCNHPEHNWPQFWCPEPGTYEKTCPGCGKVDRLVVRPIMY